LSPADRFSLKYTLLPQVVQSISLTVPFGSKSLSLPVPPNFEILADKLYCPSDFAKVKDLKEVKITSAIDTVIITPPKTSQKVTTTTIKPLIPTESKFTKIKKQR